MDNSELAKSQAKHRSIDLEVPCRKCENCLWKRQRLWAGRASAEITWSDRTWFCTFTFKPEWQERGINMARMVEARNGSDFDGLTSSAQFQARVKALGPEVQKFLKRLRKGREHGIRHIVVVEAHESGAPHFHALLHHARSTLVTYRNIADEWRHLGFLKANLVSMEDHRPAFYVCKYLGKSNDARVRASLHYGQCPPDLDHMKF